jgi:hypothetical protein
MKFDHLDKTKDSQARRSVKRTNVTPLCRMNANGAKGIVTLEEPPSFLSLKHTLRIGTSCTPDKTRFGPAYPESGRQIGFTVYPVPKGIDKRLLSISSHPPVALTPP